MKNLSFFTRHIEPSLPDIIKCKEISKGCVKIKNIHNGKFMHYYYRADKVFIDNICRWHNNIMPSAIIDLVKNNLIDGYKFRNPPLKQKV